MPTDKKSIQAYNKHFKEWLDKKGLGHSHLEKPAMYSSLGDVRGKNILCLGCGAGEECQYIKSLGAKKVVGVDISKSLVTLAKTTFPEIEFELMDMEKLKLANASFDVVYSSLVLHYVKDWAIVLKEAKRVLKKGGIFLFSTHNPVYFGASENMKGDIKFHLLGYAKNKKTGKIEVYGNYLSTRKVKDIWFNKFKVNYYHKPFSSMINEIVKSGFQIVDCIEPKPIKSAKKINFEFWKKSTKISMFIIFKLKK